MIANFRPFIITTDWAWVKERTNVNYSEDLKGFVVENEWGNLVAAAVFRDWSITAVSVHQAIEDPMVFRHGFLEEIANYVFVQADRAIIYGPTPSDNKAAIKINKHYGFKEEFRLKDAVMFGVDLILFRMDKNDCRYLPEKYKDPEFDEAELLEEAS